MYLHQCLALATATLCISASAALHVDDQTVIRIDQIGAKHLIPQNESWPITNTSQILLLTKWSPWSPCHECRQHRIKQRLHTNVTSSLAQEIEERPCRKILCMRLWHKRRSRRRMRIVKLNAMTNDEIDGFKTNLKYYDRKPNRRKSIWSKWSSWSKCSKTCSTERYKVCKKPGRCLKMKKYETALCYYPNTLCEDSVNFHLSKYDVLWTKPPSITTARPVEVARRVQGKPSTSKPKMKMQCGKPLRKHALLKIKGGRDANRSLWPWHVAVVNQHDEPFCSGTLISPRWVLTAAHCVRTKLKIRINEFDLCQPDGEIEILIERAIRHYGFNDKNIDNDIGLLYLARAVKTPFACLPSAQPEYQEVAHKCTVLGWGARDASSDNGGYHILQEAKLPIVPWAKCKAAYSDYYISRNMLCAGYPSGRIDTCAGDSGGGLMCKTWLPEYHPNGRRKLSRYIVQAITSFGDACGKPDRYGIYTNVTIYLDWIQYTMADVTRQQRNAQSRQLHYRNAFANY